MHDFDRNAALAEDYHRPEDRILDEPDQQLHATRPPDHRLDEKPVQAGFGTCRADPLEHRRRLAPYPIGIAQIERNATDIAFVSNVGRADLERDRKTDGRGDRGGLVRIPG